MNTDLLTIAAVTDPNWDTRVAITIPASEINRLFQNAERSVQQQAKIPGFRPGKAPQDLLRKRYNREITEEVRREAINRAVPAAIQREGLRPLQMPRLDLSATGELTRSADWSIALRFDVHPTFELPDFKTCELLKPDEKQVPDEQVDDILVRLRGEGRTYVRNDEVAAAPKDMLKVSYHGTLTLADGETIPAAAASLVHADQTWLLLDDPEALPGITAALTGSRCNDQVTATISFPVDFEEPFLAGRAASYAFTVHEIHQAVLPEVTDEFAARYGAANVAELRERITQRILADRRQNFQQLWRRQIEHWMIEKCQFQLPAVTLEAETDTLFRQFQEQAHRDAENDDADHVHDEHCNHTDPSDTEGLRAQAAQTAVVRLRLRIVRDTIAQQAKLQATQQELQMELYQFANRNNITPEQLQQRFDMERLASHLSEEIIMRKVLDLIAKQATYVAPSTAVADAPAEPALA